MASYYPTPFEVQGCTSGKYVEMHATLRRASGKDPLFIISIDSKLLPDSI